MLITESDFIKYETAKLLQQQGKLDEALSILKSLGKFFTTARIETASLIGRVSFAKYFGKCFRRKQKDCI